jgi:hypothetical protein
VLAKHSPTWAMERYLNAQQLYDERAWKNVALWGEIARFFFVRALTRVEGDRRRGGLLTIETGQPRRRRLAIGKIGTNDCFTKRSVRL